MQIQIFVFFIVIQAFVACQHFPENQLPLAACIDFQPIATNRLASEKTLPSAADIAFLSLDSGKSWQDVSAGLPVDLQIYCVVASGGEVFLGSEKGLFRSTVSAAPMVWAKEKDIFLPERITGICPGKLNPYAGNYESGFYYEVPGTGLWMPMHNSLKDKKVLSVLDTPEGALLVGCDSGIFKSGDGGETWFQVFEGGMATNLVAADNAIFACGRRGVLRSTDGGEHWDLVLSKGGMAFKAGFIEGGIAAIINSDNDSRNQPAAKEPARRLLASADNGKTWQGIGAGLPPSSYIQDFKQAGKYLFCSLDTGIFRSTDRGQTWELVFHTNGKVFDLAISGQVVIAVLANAGC